MVKSDADGYTKILNHRKIIRNTQKNNYILKTKIILKPKYRLSGGPVFIFSFPRRRFAPLPPSVPPLPIKGSLPHVKMKMGRNYFLLYIWKYTPEFFQCFFQPRQSSTDYCSIFLQHTCSEDTVKYHIKADRGDDSDLGS